jgi:ParB-like chromosome segregation protein Spo0J
VKTDINDLAAGHNQQPLAFHPIADLFPLMEGTDFDALVADIKAHGLIEPIWLYEDKILDGRNRYRACLDAGVDPRYRNHYGDHASAVAYVISANIHRRHLSPEKKRELIEQLIVASPEKSDRQIAKTAKVHNETVAAVRKKVEATDGFRQLKKRIGADGKARKQPTRKFTRGLCVSPGLRDRRSATASDRTTHYRCRGQPIGSDPDACRCHY